MRGYREYKETKIDWLGAIPRHWDLVRLKYLCEITTGNKDTINRNDEGEFPFYVRSRNVERIETFSYDGEAILTAGDGDICKIWHYVNGKFDFHQRVYMLYNFKVFGKFLYYYISENFYHDVFKLSAKNTVDSLRLPFFHNFIVSLPTIEEQERIAEYLDYKTSIIDDIIEKKKRFVQRLDEKKKTIINDAVTKGLDPNSPKKDSKFKWLGEIPANWDVLNLGYLGNCQNGVSKGGEYFGKGFPFVNYGDIYRNDALPEKVEGRAQSSIDDQKLYSVVEGDVFFTRTSETVDEIGISSTCLKTIDKAVFSGFAIRFRPSDKKLNKNFSKYYFRSNFVRTYLTSEMNLVTRASLSQTVLRSLKVVLPSWEEQKAIAEYLDSKCSTINDLLIKLNLQIVKLEEYRQAIISETTTGKIDIRNWSKEKV